MRTPTKLAALVVLASALATEARADEPARGPLFHPDGPGPFKVRVGVGVLVDILPKRVVQTELRQFPQLTCNLRVGLPFGFSVDAHVDAIVVSNEVGIGLGWSHRIRFVSVGIYDREAVTYGYLGVSGFDATAWGHVNRPALTLGAVWGSERFSLTGELIFTFGQYAKLGDSQVVARQQAQLAGTALTFTLESILDAGGIIYLGAGIQRTNVDYQAWIAFSDTRTKLVYPRFLAGYVF